MAEPTAASNLLQATDEVARVVNAFLGRWRFETRVQIPGRPEPLIAWVDFEFRPVAGGRAVAGIGEGKTSDGGKAEEALLVSYDPMEQVVRFMNITSQGFVNDFRGRWTPENTIVYEPLKSRRMGQAATLNMTMIFGDETLIFRMVTTLENGATSHMEGRGVRP